MLTATEARRKAYSSFDATIDAVIDRHIASACYLGRYSVDIKVPTQYKERAIALLNIGQFKHEVKVTGEETFFKISW